MFLLVTGNRGTGLLKDLQRPDDPDPVVGMQTVGGHRIDLGQATQELLRTVLFGNRLQVLTNLLAAGRRRGKPEQERPDIEAGPADHYRLPAATMDVGNGRSTSRRKVGGSKIDRRGNDVQQVMGHAVPEFRGRLGRTDVHPLVHLHGIGVYDLSVNAFGEADGQFRLP